MAEPLTLARIRNFSIIAHIDHGKSTLADKLLLETHTIEAREMTSNQVLDDMALEQERGITIKLHAIQMKYRGGDGEDYIYNLIDTPGHVDFTYEVSRSLAACEGALLVVDATQGVEAQTIANLYLAIDAGLEIIPVLNKVDLQSAMVEEVSHQIMELLGCKQEDIILASAKAGIGIKEVLEAIRLKIRPPKGDVTAPLRCLIFDSIFDSYRGSVVYMRVFDGTIKEGDEILFMATKQKYRVEELGTLRMGREKKSSLSAGDVGYLIAGVKDVKDTRVGDTVTSFRGGATEPISGFKVSKPMVFAGVYPQSAEDFAMLRDALDKLSLNDSSLIYEPESSVALGFGFRCGFLGLLHMEIIQERLDREFNQNIVTTVPNVEYHVLTTKGDVVVVDNPSAMPEPGRIEGVEEPFIKAQIICPSEYVGSIMKLSNERRGVYKTTTYIDPTRADIHYEFPLSEIIFDFYDKLKSISRGYASLDYEFLEYRMNDLVKLDILLNGDPVDAFSTIVHRDKSFEWGKKLCSKLRELIPRQMFDIAIQAAIGQKVIARETVKALRKDVTAKCYGGDISRKRKLLEKQKEGKKRMKQVGRIEVPQEAFMAVLQISD
ncbi:MAG: translation elongation factor 4 [Bacteroidota bacterium]|nr:translation elongation factor 4 [Bacteroidota bacterium]MDP4234567.1 translation elongation factor 4 [Bacteroidota bacterium]MDP4243696.1 translation elongation factor 4 [Bacteroidota bacterium]MDP4288356.1 translation elongation factor 4 [Bacteroidota bacterium]